MYRIGIDIGGTKTAIGIVDEQGQLCFQQKYNSDDALRLNGSVVLSLDAVIRSFCVSQSLSLSQVEGLAIGIPGIIDRASQRICSCPNLKELDGLRLGPELSEVLGAPVWVENDVNLIALGEHCRFHQEGLDDLACVFVGTGIGCGLIVNGDLYVGADGSAGEFGHTVIQPDGRPCSCGSRGCLEMYCSGKALALQANELYHRTVALDDLDYGEAARLIKSANAGDAAANQILLQSFGYLGLGIANLVNIMNPRVVVLGGGIVNGWPESIAVVKKAVTQYARETARQNLMIVPSTLGEQAGILGAAEYVSRARKRL